MKKSIRLRFNIIFVGLMILLLLALWCINSWWLERYYMNQKEMAMQEAYQAIDEVVMQHVEAGENIGDVLVRELEEERNFWLTERMPEGGEDLPREQFPTPAPEISESGDFSLVSLIRRLGEQNNIAVGVIDSTTGKALLASSRDGDILVRKAQRYFLGQTKRSNVLKEYENYSIVQTYEQHAQSSYLEAWGFFSDNSTMFIMSMPLSSIQESVALSTRFMTYVGLTVLLVGSVLMYIATGSVTKPIMKLAKISEQMSNLDFAARYEGMEQDEIGILGRSMNSLSEKLEETIEQLKAANSQLQKDIAEKIQIDEMRKDFIANVSHELKTPIALIQGYAEGLTEGMCEDQDSRDYYCNVIMDEANKMNKMVRQLLTLTALEFGNDTAEMTKFNAAELIRDVLNSADILLQQKEASVQADCPDTLMVWADEFKIEEVLTNYLNNAMNHLDGRRAIRVYTESEGDRVKIFVYNTGKHIPEEDLPNVWTKFYKVDKARTRSYGGSGIGLSIVKAIMESHHQECGVENKDDGVEFWFTLKLAEEEA